MLNKKKNQLNNFQSFIPSVQLFTINPFNDCAKILHNKEQFKFSKFATLDKNDNFFYCLSSKFVRDYLILEQYKRRTKICTRIGLSENVILAKKIHNAKLKILATQIGTNKGGKFSAVQGFISFVPRRQTVKKSKKYARYLSIKINFRRYRKFSVLYRPRVNLVSTFKLKKGRRSFSFR